MSATALPAIPAGCNDMLDLKLLCANDEPVLVCSKLLKHATRSPALEDIIDQLIEANPRATSEAPMSLPVPDDSAAVWRVVWRLIENPLLENCCDLTWDNVKQVIQLADKYYLLLVLQACESFLLASIAKHPTVQAFSTRAFGYMSSTEGTMYLELDLLTLLGKVNLWRAAEILAPKYVELLLGACKRLQEKRYGATAVELVRLQRNVGTHASAMRTALTSFRSNSGGSEVAARVVGLVHEHMAEALLELV